MSLHEPVLELAKLNDLREKGFSDLDAIKEVVAVRRNDLAVAVDKLLGVVRYYDNRVEQLKTLGAEVTEALKQAEGRIDGIHEYVRFCMGEIKERFRGKAGEFVMRTKGGVLPIEYGITTDKRSFSNVVGSIERATIDPQYLVYTELWTLNTEKIREDLDRNIKIPFAKFAERGNYITETV